MKLSNPEDAMKRALRSYFWEVSRLGQFGENSCRVHKCAPCTHIQVLNLDIGSYTYRACIDEKYDIL